MSVEYFVRKIGDDTIIIDAKLDGLSKGVLKLNIERSFSGKFSASSVIISTQSGVGIPRGLLENTVNELSNFAKEKNSEITHTILLETDDSIKKNAKNIIRFRIFHEGLRR